MDTSPDRNPTPFLTALGLAGGATFLIVLVAILTVHGAYTAGYVAGRFAAGVVVGGIAVGVWAKLARRRWNWLGYVWRLAVCSLALIVLSLLGSFGAALHAVEASRVTEAEKHGLELGPVSVRHRGLGFVLPHPGAAFHADSQIQRRLNALAADQPAVFAWVLRNDSLPEAVVVMVTKGANRQGDFSRFVAGMRSTLPRGERARILEDTLVGSGRASEFRFAAQASTGLYLKSRCLPAIPERGVTVIVCVQTTSTAPDGLDGVRGGLTVRQVEP